MKLLVKIKPLQFLLLLTALAVGFAIGVSAKDFLGASYQDIISAMGPDALGLEFVPERLPDVSDMALGRLQDRSEKFIVEHPYTAGRWKGGRAVVEYARDLTYAMISIYDQAGRRQRIYSVRARPQDADTKQAQFQTLVNEISMEEERRAARPQSNAAADLQKVDTADASPPKSKSKKASSTAAADLEQVGTPIVEDPALAPALAQAKPENRSRGSK